MVSTLLSTCSIISRPRRTVTRSPRVKTLFRETSPPLTNIPGALPPSCFRMRPLGSFKSPLVKGIFSLTTTSLTVAPHRTFIHLSPSDTGMKTKTSYRNAQMTTSSAPAMMYFAFAFRAACLFIVDSLSRNDLLKN